VLQLLLRVFGLTVAFSTLACAGLRPDAPRLPAGADAATTASFVEDCLQRRGFRERGLRIDGERITIHLGVCVPAEDAVRILRSLKQGQWANRQKPPWDAPWQGIPPLPRVVVSDVYSISLPFSYLAPGSVPQPFEYQVLTREGTHPNGSEGYSFIVILRGEQVELTSVGSWVT
jgi:hypothetical protein